MKYCLIFLLVSLLSCSSNDNYSTENDAAKLKQKEWVSNLLNKNPDPVSVLNQASVVEEEIVGIIGAKSKTYKQFERLLRKSSKKDLEELLHHENEIVRAYAFKGITLKYPKAVLENLVEVADDSSKVGYFSGCLLRKLSVANLCIEWVTEDYAGHHQLSFEEKIYFDSLILNGDYPFLRYKEKLIQDRL